MTSLPSLCALAPCSIGMKRARPIGSVIHVSLNRYKRRSVSSFLEEEDLAKQNAGVTALKFLWHRFIWPPLEEEDLANKNAGVEALRWLWVMQSINPDDTIVPLEHTLDRITDRPGWWRLGTYWINLEPEFKVTLKEALNEYTKEMGEVTVKLWLISDGANDGLENNKFDIADSPPDQSSVSVRPAMQGMSPAPASAVWEAWSSA